MEEVERIDDLLGGMGMPTRRQLVSAAEGILLAYAIDKHGLEAVETIREADGSLTIKEIDVVSGEPAGAMWTVRSGVLRRETVLEDLRARFRQSEVATFGTVKT